MSRKAERYRITSLQDARKWVWAHLMRRVGRASAESLRRAWWWDPTLLDDALTSLRDQGMIQCVSGVWHAREVARSVTSAALLPEPPARET